ncbi:MAG: Spy/CpxP family protein refolding chaperone, partial [Polaromonas sp.]
LDKLATPERIDKMRALRTQRMTEMNAEMDKRGEATKAFYSALSPEQKKTFDAEHQKMGQHKGHGHGRGHHESGMRHSG